MDNTSIISWNVYGLNAQARQDNVRTLVNDLRPSIVCLQETKLDVIPNSLVWSMLGIDFRDFAYLPTMHTRGGILVAGRATDVRFSDVLVGCYSVTVSVHAPDPGDNAIDNWWLTIIYGPQEVERRRYFWRNSRPLGTPVRDPGQSRVIST